MHPKFKILPTDKFIDHAIILEGRGVSRASIVDARLREIAYATKECHKGGYDVPDSWTREAKYYIDNEAEIS